MSTRELPSLWRNDGQGDRASGHSNRVVQGVRVPHVCGDPALSEGQDRDLGGRIVRTALHALTAPVSGPTLFEPLAAAPAPVRP